MVCIMPNIKENIVIVLGETGVGKSSFINAITGKNECFVSSKGIACTNDIKFVSTSILYNLFVFVDTPGLNDGKGDEKNISKIKEATSKFPRIQNILILLKFTDNRLTNSLKSSLKEFMRCFPTKNFWKHVLIVRTFAKRDEDFEEEKNNIKGQFLNSIFENDHKDLLEFMKENHIEVPKEIQEFFVDSKKKDEQTKVEFINIFNSINKSSIMYKSVKTRIENEVVRRDGFEILKKKRIINFIDFDGDRMEISEDIEEEVLCKDKIIRCEESKEKTDNYRRHCFTPNEILYNYFRTNYYLVKGTEIKGVKFYTGNGWEKDEK